LLVWLAFMGDQEPFISAAKRTKIGAPKARTRLARSRITLSSLPRAILAASAPCQVTSGIRPRARSQRSSGPGHGQGLSNG
jgi:hypothetical protein